MTSLSGRALTSGTRAVLGNDEPGWHAAVHHRNSIRSAHCLRCYGSAGSVLLQHLKLNGTQPCPKHVRLDPTEIFLYVLNRHGLVHVLEAAVRWHVDGESHAL